MHATSMGPMERAWCFAGFAAFADAELAAPEVLCAGGEVPILVYPACYDAAFWY